MTASKRSTPHRGHALINRLERFSQVCTNRLNHEDYNYTRGDVEVLQAHLRNAIYRLRFLEMVVLGLTHGEMDEIKRWAEAQQDAEIDREYWRKEVNRL